MRLALSKTLQTDSWKRVNKRNETEKTIDLH